MEELFEILKNFILTTFNDELKSYEDEKNKLPKITAKQIVFGSIDPMKQQGNIAVSIYPETQETEEETITSFAVISSFTVTFVFRNELYETLIKRMCRYSACFKKSITENYSLNGEIGDSDIGLVKFYPDCGPNEKQMTAAEIELTIKTSEEFNYE